MFDAAIVGTGPAGLSAAMNLKLLNKTFVWFGSAAFSDKVQKSEKIANYPGAGPLSGKELNAAFARQVQELELPITERMVTNISHLGTHFMLLAENEIYEAKTVLLAPGVVAAKGFAGEERLLGSGVSYCATCDGFLYRGKTIAVYCGSKRFEHEVVYLAGLAKTVYFYPGYKGCDLELPNLVRLPMPIKEIQGGFRVTGLTLTDGTAYAVDGVFCLRSAVAPATLLPGLETDGPHITVDRRMAANIPGCFAAGDCTGRPYQITKAVGEGNIAAHSMVEFLAAEKAVESTEESL